MFENGADEMVRVLIHRKFEDTERPDGSEPGIISLRPIHKPLNRQPAVTQKHISEKRSPNQTTELSWYCFQQPGISGEKEGYAIWKRQR